MTVSPSLGSDQDTRLEAVRGISASISAAHMFIYLVPEIIDEAAVLGVTDPVARYFAFRSAALGAVPWHVALAAFYNFSPRAAEKLAGVWDIAPPRRWQSGRFAAADRAMGRVDVGLTADEVAEARSLIDPVVARADYAGKTLAAANAATPLPNQPMVALWQQITVLREWRGDAHMLVLANHRLGPCDCNVLHAATGRLPAAVLRTTREWNDSEWSAAATRLADRGWVDERGAATEAGFAAREQIEVETDVHCDDLWATTGDDDLRRLATLIAPIADAFTAAGTFAQLH